MNWITTDKQRCYEESEGIVEKMSIEKKIMKIKRKNILNIQWCYYMW